jgi:LmbE family N-acetylglucosaminyl deacetylase
LRDTPDGNDVGMSDVMTDKRCSGDVSWLGTTLTVWAHPDDETYLGGGLSAALSDQGVRVVCVTATRGEAGGRSQDPASRTALAELRTLELEAALEILGVAEHEWLDCPDGGCATADTEAVVDRLVRIIDRVRPDTVVTFGPEGHTGHLDHRTVSRWVDEAITRAGSRARLLHVVVTEAQLAVDPALNDDFGVFDEGGPRVCDPDDLALRMDLDRDLLRRKVKALQRQPSQSTGLIGAVGLDRFAAWIAVECFAVPAEGSHSHTCIR